MLDAGAHKYVEFLKDVGTGTTMLGCADCLDFQICGGLHLPAGTFHSCMSHCTCTEEQRSECDVVCPRKPRDLVRRIREVVTFDLNNIPKTNKLTLPNLPRYLPLVHGRSAAGKASHQDYLALPLSYALIGRGNQTRARTARELVARTGMHPRVGWVLSGTEDDRFVERFWGLANAGRIFEGMRKAGVVFATSPNFSLTNEVPRHDNLHAMKRIAWVWHQMQQAGIPTALHINGRTDRDFERWAEFANQRQAVKAVAFEFLTGALPRLDQERYVGRLQHFAAKVGRKLHLVLRGPSTLVAQLRPHFAGVTFVDSSAYQRAVHRRQAFLDERGQVRYEPVLTQRRSQVAALFAHNDHVMRKTCDPLVIHDSLRQGRLDFWAADLTQQTSSLPRQDGTDDETSQFNLFSA